MKKETSKRLTRAQLAELKSLAALADDAIDRSDAPELLDWSGAKRGLFYRPVKQQLTLRLDERCAGMCEGRQAGVGGDLWLEVAAGANSTHSRFNDLGV
jgi:hypothetical protein